MAFFSPDRSQVDKYELSQSGSATKDRSEQQGLLSKSEHVWISSLLHEYVEVRLSLLVFLAQQELFELKEMPVT
jgi:hypothetical protein